MQVDFAKPWYHGSPLQLEVLSAGSSVAQLINLARVFSHKPRLLSFNNETYNSTQRHATRLFVCDG